MTFESVLGLVTGGLWASPMLLGPAVVFLEVERRWTRTRRRDGKTAPMVAYLLDLLAVLAALAGVLGTIAFIVGVIVLAVMWVVAVISSGLAWLMANPIALFGTSVAVVVALVILGFARGWISLPKRATPAAAAEVAPDLPMLTDSRSPGSAAKAPPAAAPKAGVVNVAAADSRAARPRPSPVMVRHRGRPGPSSAQQTAAKSAAQAAADAEHARIAEASGLAMLNDRRVGPGAERGRAAADAPVYSPSGAQTDDEPTLAMLNNRGRSMHDRGSGEAARQPIYIPTFTPAETAAPKEKKPANSGWWHIPLAVTSVLVLLVASAIVVLGPTLPSNLTDLQAIVGRMGFGDAPAAQQGEAVQPGAGDATTQPAAGAAEVEAAAVGTARVNADRLNVRAAPGTNARALGVLQRGDTVDLLGEEESLDDGVWVKVRAGKLEGWVKESFLR